MLIVKKKKRIIAFFRLNVLRNKFFFERKNKQLVSESKCNIKTGLQQSDVNKLKKNGTIWVVQ